MAAETQRHPTKQGQIPQKPFDSKHVSVISSARTEAGTSAARPEREIPDDDRWLSVGEIAEYLGISKDTVYAWITDKGLSGHRIGRLWKFKRSEVGGCIEERPATSSETMSEVIEEMAKRVDTTATNGQAKRPEKDVVCVDLFCGAGGLTHGLIDAGVNVAAGVDFDKGCKHPYESNHEGIEFHQADVAKLEASKIEEWFGDATVRVLAGCAPCQPFSNYALRYQKGEDGNNVEDDERWSLLNHFGRLVEEVMPDVVTMENVPTITKHAVFKKFKSTLERLGYSVWVEVIDCTRYGLPQRRHRTVLLASLFGEIELRDPDASMTRTVGDVLKGLPQLRHGRTSKKDRLHTASRLSPLNLERINVSTPGGSWHDWPKHLIAKCHLKTTGKTYPSVYGRMKWDEPAPTLTTQFYGFGSGRFGHPTQARGLSLREGAILQGFPKDYSFVPDDEPLHFKALGRMIGNAVPVDLGRVIGRSIIEHVKRHVGQPSSSTNQRRRGRNGRDRTGSAVLA